MLLCLLCLADKLLVYLVEVRNGIVVLCLFVPFRLEGVVPVLENVRVAHGTLRVSLHDPLTDTDSMVAVPTR